MFSKGHNRGVISYVEMERVPEGWSIITEGVTRNYYVICELYCQKKGYEET